MSNFSGNVDVVREREAERQARLQLLDGIREPSPQPIFGEPIRVDPSAEDETSRRIKDTLGDFNHVQHYLINDPKHLIGISRSAPTVARDEHGSGLWGPTSRQQLSSSRPGQAPRDSSAIKKPPLINGTHKPYSSSGVRVETSKTSHPPLTKPSSEKKAPVKIRIDNLKNAIHGVFGTSVHVEKDKPREKGKDSNRTREREHSSYSVPSSNPVTVNNCSNVTVNVANVSIAGDAFNNCSNPLSLIVHNGSHPNGLIRDTDCDSNNKRTQAKHSLTKLSIPVQKNVNVESHIELKSIFQEMKEAVPPPLTAIHTPKNDGSGFSFPLESSLVPFDKQDEQSPIHQTPPPTKKTTVASTVNLQEDLEMSDSDDDDDEPGAFKISPTPVEYVKSPSKPVMEKAPASPGGQSSSSESSCSDSEESSSSDSNDSDSSASSEGSDQEAPSTPTPQTWGLTNFFDETRRNHSPAFMPLDNNTNSSTAVKEEPVQSVGSLADEDSVNYILGKYSLQSPITDLLGLNDAGGDDAKSEILSPIRSLSPPSGQPSLRGPHTPPTPPELPEEKVNENVSKKEKVKQDAQKVSQTKNESKKLSEPVNAASDVQNNKVKARVGKSKSSSHSRTSEAGEISRTDSKEISRTDSKEHSASKNSTKVSTAEVKPSAVPAITVTSTTTCPVPSVTTTTERGSPIKPHHKHSSAVKRTKSCNELKNSDVKKEAKKSHTFPKPSSAKTVPPPKFSETDSADGKKLSNSLKSESSVQSDSASKLEKETHTKKTDDSSVAKKNKDSHSRSSSGHDSKSSSSSTPKVKQKSEKTKPPNEPIAKKSEKKKKPVKKFSIKDFIQSPVPPPPPLSEDEVSIGSPFRKSPTPERTLSPEVRREENNEQKLSPASLPSSRTHSPGKPSSKVSEKNKRKHSHSSVVDVINSVARGDVFDHPREETKRPSAEISEELASIIADKSSEAHLPVHVVAPQLLSPISVDSPAPSNKSESAISSVMVSIPFEMLFRVPRMKSKHKTSNHSEDKTVPAPVKEKVPSAEKSSNQPPADKPLLSDDIKSKYRTDSADVRTSKGTPNKKEKHAKESKHSQGSSSSVNKSSSNSSSKSSSKVASSISDSASSVSKKRKFESDENPHLKKKPKVPLKPAHTVKKEPKEPSPVVKIEPVSPLPSEPKHSPKPLERVGSASSLCSFSSQQSHKSSKGVKEKSKDRVKDEPDSKRLKNSSSSATHVKEIKREKEEKVKNREKKECSSSEKTRTSKESATGKESEKVHKSEPTWDSKENISAKDKLLKTEPVWDEFHNLSSQFIVRRAMSTGPMEISIENSIFVLFRVVQARRYDHQSGHWDVQCKSEESKMCKSEESKMMPTNHERQNATESHKRYASTFDWQNFTPGAEQTPKRSNKQCSSDEYYMEEAKKMKHQADKQPDAVLQAMQYLEAVLLFILTACHKEKNNKDAESIFRLYKETLQFSYFVSNTIQKLQNSCSTFGSIDYKLLILTLRCQSLLCLKLYYLRRNEVKEHQKGVSDFMKQSTSYRLIDHPSPLPANSSSFSRNISQPSPCQPRLGTAGGVPSPHSPTPSPAGSVNSQSSGYSSSEMNSYHSRPQGSLQSTYAPAVVSVPQNVFDMMKRQHTHLNNLHNCHELWEQADMYMTRSHSKEFFKEIAEQSHQLTLHSSIDELVNYVQRGLSLLKDMGQ